MIEYHPRRDFLTPPSLWDDSADVYLADLMAIWRNDAEPEALRQITADIEPTALIDCIRYALIRTSMNSAAGNYVPEVISRAVDTGLWTGRRALRLAALIREPWQRAKLYTLLLSTDKLSDAERNTAQSAGLAAIFSLEEGDTHFEYLQPLAPHLSTEALDQALELANDISDPSDRVMSMQALMPYLAPDPLKNTVELARSIIPTIKDGYDGPFDRLWAMINLLPYLSLSEREQTAIEILNTYPELRWDERRSAALVMLAPFLSTDQLKWAIDSVSAIEDEVDHAYALAVLSQRMDKGSAEDAVGRFLYEVHKTRYRSHIAYFTKSLASKVDDRLRTNLIEAIFPYLLLADDENDRATALMVLVGYFNDDQIVQLQSLVDQTTNKIIRAILYTALIPHLKDKVRDRAIQEALHTTLYNADDRVRLQLLMSLAPELSRKFITQALKSFALFKYSNHASATVEILTPQVNGRQQDQRATSGKTSTILTDNQVNDSIIKMLTHDTDKRPDFEDLADLASRLTPDLRAEVLKNIPESMSDDFSIRFLTALAPHENPESWESDEGQLLQSILAIEGERTRAPLLAILASRSVDSLIPQLLDAACTLTQSWSREKVMVELAPRVTSNLLPQALDCVGTISEEFYRWNALAYLAPQLTGDALLQQYLDAVVATEDYEDRYYWMVKGVAPHLTGQLLDRGLTIARAIKDQSARLKSLIAFLPMIAAQRPAERPALIREIRQLIVTLLHDSEYQGRDAVLDLLATENLFAPPIVSQTTIRAAIEQILEICVHWKWGQAEYD